MERPCWTLNDATDGIGRYPQLEGFLAEFARGHSNALDELPRGNLPDDMAFPVALLAARAKRTDMISTVRTGNFGYLISQRFRDVLEAFQLPPHRLYPASLEHRRRAVDGYWWLHLPQPDLLLGEEMPPKAVEAVISADPVVGTVDMLRLYYPARYRYCFVSGPLRTALETAGVTGVRFGTAKVFQ